MDPNSISITFWQFQKKKNSTALPSAQGTVLSCSIKDLCTETRPVIRLRLSPNYPQFNYCYIQSFLRYYWIDEWTYNEGIWEAACTVDPLASFRAQIMASEKYVTRCADADYYDGSIPDEYYVTKSGAAVQAATPSANPWSTAGCYVIGVVGPSNSLTEGSVSYYALSASQMKSMLNYMFSGSVTGQLTDETLSENYIRTHYNPFAYIVSCQWFPTVSFLNSDFLVNHIKMGYIDVAVGAYSVPTTLQVNCAPITIKRHSQAATRGNYLNLEPWSRYTLKFAPFCCVDLDSNKLYGESTINFSCKIDVATGVGRLIVTTGSGKFLGLYEAQIGVPIQIAAVSRDKAGMAAGIIGGIASAAIGAVTGNVGAIFNNGGIGSALKASAPALQSTGTNGAKTAFSEIPTLYTSSISLVPENLADKGRPCCKVLELSDLSGYVECADGHIAATLLADEYDMLETYMTGGFYLE